MKKLLLIIALSFSFSESAYAEKYFASSTGYYFFPDRDQVMQATSKISLDDAKKKAIKHCQESQMMSKGKPESCLIYRVKVWGDGMFGKLLRDEVVWDNEVAKFEKILKEKNVVEKQKEQDAIMFTIKDKREQCEAIGFKPETENFADCVLRLVELDVRKQQDQKIASAQNSGNMEIANQLLQMRNDNNAQYLMNLGQQLLKPQQFNSNIYLPQTQNCFLQGFDSFAKMTCR